MRSIDLNADLGEGGTEDEALLALVTSANIACGGHAGDGETMRRTVDLALKSGVAIGAHPGYEDREHFGRMAMVLPFEEVTELVRRQVEKLSTIARDSGARVHHVKPHGALYNQAGREPALAAAVIAGIVAVSPELLLYTLPGNALADAARSAGLAICPEGFADRRYREDGSLMPRGEPGAVIKDVEEAVTQALKLADAGAVQTLCVHGDGPTAVAILRDLRGKLGTAGFVICGRPRNDA